MASAHYARKAAAAQVPVRLGCRCLCWGVARQEALEASAVQAGVQLSQLHRGERGRCVIGCVQPENGVLLERGRELSQGARSLV
eukprot:3674259-Prymnesium_polylepis.1